MTTPLTIPADLYGEFEPAPEQRAVIELAATSKVIVCTGGPGTGKTQTQLWLLKLLAANDITDDQVVICAPTGQAAVRARALTGHDAVTIHRLLGSKRDGTFRANALNPLTAKVVIADEFSMVDVRLAAALLAATPTGARLIIVGDDDQLPSIGPGCVLHDLIASGKIPTIHLTKIFRQADASAIPYAARAIRDGESPDFDALQAAGDLKFAQIDDEQELLRAVELAFDRLPALGFTAKDIQVLVPQHGTEIGVSAINVRLQTKLTGEPPYYAVRIGNDYRAQPGDRVIHRNSNNYELGVANGEIGHVILANWRGLDGFPTGCLHSARNEDGTLKDIDPLTRAIVIDFGDRIIAYTRDEAQDLHLGYAITIHSAQGSAFPAAIVVMHSKHGFMLTRKLAYTVVTRAERLCLVLGQRKAVAAAARNLRGSSRMTTLRDRLSV